MAKIIIDPFTGEKHLPGSALCCFVTLCGEVDTFESSNGSASSKTAIETTGLPNCVGCINAAKLVFKSITKKELAKL